MVGTEDPISKPHYSSPQILSLSLPLLNSCHRGGLSIPCLGISSRLASKQHFNREETETWDVCDGGKRLKSRCGRKSTPCSLKTWLPRWLRPKERHLLTCCSSPKLAVARGTNLRAKARSVITPEVFMTMGNTEAISGLVPSSKRCCC